MLSAMPAFSQVEHIPLDNPVYDFLQRMNIKQIIPTISTDDPNLSRGEIEGFIRTIESKRTSLSTTEKKLLDKYRVEFIPEEMNYSNSTGLFNPGTPFKQRVSDILSNKKKYLYFSGAKEKGSIYAEEYGRLLYANLLKPNKKENAKFTDVGLRFSGTLFKHLGYDFSVVKGALFGSTALAEKVDPRILYNFKYVENNAGENVRSYDFVDGYLRYYTEPAEDMKFSVELGREKLKYGFSYTQSLAFSGNHPDMDFIKFNFNYGVLHYSSVFASTVGEFNPDRSKNYTKYIAMNRMKLAFPKVIDIGIAESIVSSRGIELAYLNPVIFYKFIEHSLQDRDNGTIFFDFQTHMIKDLQFQGMFFLDENILSNLGDLTKQSNKTAYQLGAFWYEPAGIKDISLTLEYTKIRPYVYTHADYKNTYTSFGQIVGNDIGPNADKLFAGISYNYSDFLTLSLNFSRIRKGYNIYDGQGNLTFNAGGDVFQPYREGTDADHTTFLAGNKVSTDNAQIGLQIEPLRDYIFDIRYIYNLDNHLTEGFKSDYSFFYAAFHLNY